MADASATIRVLADASATVALAEDAVASFSLLADAATTLEAMMSVVHDITPDALRQSGFRPLHAGDDYDYTVALLAADGETPFDLAGASIWFTAKEAAILTDSEAKLQLTIGSGISVPTPANGQLIVEFRGAETENLEGIWKYDLQIKDSTGKIRTVAYGVLEFLPNITRATS